MFVLAIVAIVYRVTATAITAALCVHIPKMATLGRFWPMLYVVFVAVAPVSASRSGAYGDGRPSTVTETSTTTTVTTTVTTTTTTTIVDINSICPLPHWDNASMDMISRHFRINDTDIASVPWVHGNSSNVLNVPTVECKHHADHRRVVVLLIDAIHRPLFEKKYPLVMNFSRLYHDVFHFNHHHTHGFNSPPNKQALYAGILKKATSATYTPKWLHKTFNQSGYTTIHADDVCKPTIVPGALTAIMGTKPGDVMPDDRALCTPRFPSCTDPDPSCSATSSLEFVAQAVEQHQRCDLFVTVNPNQEHSMRWWYSKADLWMLRFLERVVTRTTIVVILSDHGLHYGPASISPLGTAYRTNPFLMILWPKRMRGATSKALQRSTSASLTTHLNVYAFLDAIASGNLHSDASLASPNFALNQTCKEAFIPNTECRCILSGSCTFAAKQMAMTVLEDHLQVVSANPHCRPLNKSEFSMTSCTGVETAHVASFKRGHRFYQLKWDSEEANLAAVQQKTSWKKDIDPCRTKVPLGLWPLCICSSTVPAPFQLLPFEYTKPFDIADAQTDALALFTVDPNTVLHYMRCLEPRENRPLPLPGISNSVVFAYDNETVNAVNRQAAIHVGLAQRLSTALLMTPASARPFLLNPAQSLAQSTYEFLKAQSNTISGAASGETFPCARRQHNGAYSAVGESTLGAFLGSYHATKQYPTHRSCSECVDGLGVVRFMLVCTR
eukprot:gene15717-26501_t